MLCDRYITGSGDRHLDNFLLHEASGALVPIDFGCGSAACLLTLLMRAFILWDQTCAPLGGCQDYRIQQGPQHKNVSKSLLSHCSVLQVHHLHVLHPSASTA